MHPNYTLPIPGTPERRYWRLHQFAQRHPQSLRIAYQQSADALRFLTFGRRQDHRDVEEMSYQEIEEITGLAAGTVKSRIHRARGQLREIVERELGEKIR